MSETERATRIAPTCEVRVGDRVTEIDTPDGPFYTVTRETAKSFWIDGDVRVGKSERAGVRVLIMSTP